MVSAKGGLEEEMCEQLIKYLLTVVMASKRTAE